jgi:hypothetical protein
MGRSCANPRTIATARYIASERTEPVAQAQLATAPSRLGAVQANKLRDHTPLSPPHTYPDICGDREMSQPIFSSC